MNIIIIILIFVIVLFIYLHIFYHLKVSNDLEVFEVSNLSKERLEEVCNLRQPFSFYLDINCFDNLQINRIKKLYSSFDVKIREKDFNKNAELYIPISFKKSRLIIDCDTSSNYFSEDNQEFLNETSLIKDFKINDYFLRPSYLMSKHYDYLMGSTGSITPLRYDICYRNYFLLINGDATIKVTPPKNSKYLYSDKDYDNFEFRSPLNLWNIQKQYKNDFTKVKSLDIKLDKGKIVFIPAYWWYTIKYNSNDALILNFKYKTYMNNIAIIPYYIKYFLQKQNIKHNIIKNIKRD